MNEFIHPLPAKTAAASGPVQWLRALVLIAGTGLLIEGAWFHWQMYVFDGQIKYPTILLKFLLLSAFTAGALFLNHTWVMPRKIALPWLVFIFYLVIHALYLSAFVRLPITTTLFGYNAYYFFLLILPVLFVLKDCMPGKWLLLWFLLLSLPLALLGLAQYITNHPIVPVQSNDDRFMVQSLWFFGQVRAVSLFPSPGTFGNIIALACALSTAWFLNAITAKNRRTLLYVGVLILIMLLTAFTTLTRAVYLQAASVLGFCLLWRWTTSPQRSTWLKLWPIFTAFFGFITALVAGGVLGRSEGLLSVSSLQERLYQWRLFLDVWWSENSASPFFGLGYMPYKGFGNIASSDLKAQNLDNSFLAIGVHIGLIGLLLWLWLMWQAWGYILRSAMAAPTPWRLGLAAFWSTWALSGVFNVNLVVYPLILLFAIFSSTYEQQAFFAMPCSNPPPRKWA